MNLDKPLGKRGIVGYTFGAAEAHPEREKGNLMENGIRYNFGPTPGRRTEKG